MASAGYKKYSYKVRILVGNRAYKNFQNIRYTSILPNLRPSFWTLIAFSALYARKPLRNTILVLILIKLYVTQHSANSELDSLTGGNLEREDSGSGAPPMTNTLPTT